MVRNLTLGVGDRIVVEQSNSHPVRYSGYYRIEQLSVKVDEPGEEITLTLDNYDL